MNINLKNITIKIEFSIFVILAIIIFSKNYDAFYLILFSMLHELGHIVSLYIMGGKVDVLTFSFYGIGIKHKSALSNVCECVFLLSGLIINLLFVLINIKRNINFCLFIINALPVYPLDMGRVVQIALNNFLSINISYLICSILGIIEIILLFIVSFWQKNINLLLIGFYVLFFWIKEVFYDKKRS